MEAVKKTKSLSEIENKMRNIDENSLRYRVLLGAKNFKTSWIDLGQALYSVYTDKAYREWGYNTFDAYSAREIGIRKVTAMKLLKSYYFLEKEEPAVLDQNYLLTQDAALVPSYESIDLLRLAKNKKNLDGLDYANFKKAVFEKGKDACEVKKELTALIRQRQELEPEEAREKKKISTVKRFLGILKSLKQEMETLKFVSAPVLREVASLIGKLESEIS